MKLRKSRTRRRGRIEIIPMIDVMFFLLATFMLASLAMQNLHSVAVNLPKGIAAPLQAKQPVTLAVTRDGGLFLNDTPVALDTLAQSLRAMLLPDSTVIVAADSEAQNGLVVQAMLRAKEAGAERFQIAVKHE
jgi:biopolymer transport protein ExbD